MKEYKKNQKRASTRKQANNYDESGIDPFSRAPAGYGLTQTPGKWPWDNPPEIVDVAFTQGLITPDVAEMLNIPLSAHLLVEADRAGVAPKFNNNVKLDVLPDEQISDIMRSLNPERYMQYAEGKVFPKIEEELTETAKPAKENMKGFMASMKKSAAQQESTDGN